MKPRFPLYIPSKGRSEYMITSKVLTKMGVDHNIVVEPQEVQKYKDAIAKFALRTTVIELDMSYKKKYDLCDDLGLTMSTGSGPARNFIWDHSISNGHKWHWIMDDNIREFYRMHRNLRYGVRSPIFWRMMEDFVLRYKNVAMAGPNYSMFSVGAMKDGAPPFITNTRIYSCNLIRNDVPFRWRGRFNEDTIMSLDMLKAGWCTIQFYAFLQDKMKTQLLRGGNTDEIYQQGTMEKSKMLVREHPDVAEVVFKYGRWHHHVDYGRFKKNKLIRRDDLTEDELNPKYDLKLINLK